MPRFGPFVLACSLVLAACGGSGGRDAAPDPTIRFEGTYENDTVAIAPLAGSETIGSRAIAQVELRLDHGPAQVLAAPNARNAAGQAIYLFPVTTTGEPAFRCGVPVSFATTVTDVEGFSFTKYVATCHRHVFGGFSDWGPRSVRIGVEGTLPMRASFQRAGEGGYSDEGASIAGEPSAGWTLNAREGDRAMARAEWNPQASGTLSLLLEGSGDSVAVSRGQPTASMNAVSAELVCCSGPEVTPESTRTGRTVSLVVAPGFTRPFSPDEPPPQFDVSYRVFDPLTQTVVAQFTGTGADYTTYTFDVLQGYQMTLEASPASADAQATLFISYGTGRDLESPHSGNSLGSAQSNRVGAPALLNVFCCALRP